MLKERPGNLLFCPVSSPYKKYTTMNIEIVNKPLAVDIHGFSGAAINKDYVNTAFKLSDKMWQAVQGNNLKHKGLNVWVYEPHEMVFAGVELEETPGPGTGLEQKSIFLPKYAYYKHIGPYKLIKEAGMKMTEELKRKGLETGLPYIEIYGHWNNDEIRLETELLMSLK